MSRTLRTAAAVAALALFASACSGETEEAPDAVVADPDDGEHRTCVPLAEFDDGDVQSAAVQDVDFPWDRPDPVVLEGFDFSQVISG